MSSVPVSPQEAVKIAVAYVQEMYGAQAQDILLEEIELPPPETSWMVTLSFVRQAPAPFVTPSSAIAQALGAKAPRLYKKLEVDANTGVIRAMRIREGA